MSRLAAMIAAFSLLLYSAMLLQGCTPPISDETLTLIDSRGVANRLTGKAAANTILIDSRPPEQFQQGRLPGAVNLRLEDVAAGRTMGLERYSTIVVYGQNPGSGTATALAKRLLSLGYNGVRLFDGGVDAWTASGLALERAEPLQVTPGTPE